MSHMVVNFPRLDAFKKTSKGNLFCFTTIYNGQPDNFQGSFQFYNFVTYIIIDTMRHPQVFDKNMISWVLTQVVF